MKLDSINFWFLCFSFTFHLPNHGFTSCVDYKCSLNLSSEQRKVSSSFLEKINKKVFWSKNFGLLGITSVHGRPESPSWYTNSWPYIVPPRVEPYCRLPSLLVHSPCWERNTHAMLHKCGAVRQLKHGKSGLQIITLTDGTDLYFK